MRFIWQKISALLLLARSGTPDELVSQERGLCRSGSSKADDNDVSLVEAQSSTPADQLPLM